MKKPFLLPAIALAGLLLPSLLFSQQRETILEARIWLDGKTMTDLEKAGLEIDHGFYDPGKSFRSEFSASELSQVKAAGFRMDTLEADVVARYLRENAVRKPVRTYPVAGERGGGPCDAYGVVPATPANYTYGSMGGFYRYQEFLDILDDMRAKFPNLISVRQVVSPTLLTHQDRPLWYVRISDHPDTDEDEPEALYTAVHHAREPNSLTHLIYFMWHLLENYEGDPELRYLIDHTELYFIPCLNPDGYIYNQTTDPNGGGYWRKNRRDNGNSSYGVDLNRNYGYEWGSDAGSSGSTASDTYRGPAPFSEPETQMARDFIEAHNFEIVLNCHTSGNRLVHPWGYEDVAPTIDFTTLSDWLTRESHYFAGTCWQALGYLASGTSDDWMFGEKGKFAFTPETGLGFWPTIDQIDGNNKSMYTTNLSAAQYALGGAVILHRPGGAITGNMLNVTYRVKQYELGAAPVHVSFEALTPNIQGFPAISPLSMTDFAAAEFNAAVTLKNGIQTGDTIRFVASSMRLGQIHTDTFETTYAVSPFKVLFSDNNEMPNSQWEQSQWGATTEQAYSPSKSMTDSPFDIYTSVENFLTSAPLTIPANATEARLRFFTRWDIEPELDWAQVLLSGPTIPSFAPLSGTLTRLSPVIGEPVYDGSHLDWAEECIDLGAFIGKSVNINFAMIAYSGNINGRDGFYFDDILLEYKTPGGVFTLDIPDDWNLQSRPNPANGQTLVLWETAGLDLRNAQLEI